MTEVDSFVWTVFSLILIVSGSVVPFQILHDPGSAAVHIEPASPIFNHFHEFVGGKLVSLIGVDDLWCAMAIRAGGQIERQRP